MIRSDSQCGRILRVLADGAPHSVPEIHRRAGTSRLNSRIAELRKQGCEIVCERIPGKRGASAYRYTLTSVALSDGERAALLPPSPEPENGSYALDADAYADRSDPAQRYRLYALTALDESPRLVATCESPAAVGVALLTLASEGEYERSGVGVLDAQSGSWILNPYDGRC